MSRQTDSRFRRQPVKPDPSRSALWNQVRQVLRARNLSRRTAKAHTGWIWRFLRFYPNRDPRTLDEPEISAFLTHLATHDNVSASTQNQARSALLFLFRRVLNRDTESLKDVVRTKVTVGEPDRARITDINCLRTWRGWLYLAAVMDLYSRLIIGWSMQPTLARDLVLDALLMAVWRRRPSAPVAVHSDQGSQFGSDDWIRFCEFRTLDPSMGRRGNCRDHAVAEFFFSSLKKERIGKRIYRTRDLAKADAFDYIEMFYNRARRHSHQVGTEPGEVQSFRKRGAAMKSWGKALGFGFLVWLLLFVIAFMAFPLRNSARPLFESIMSVAVAATAVGFGLIYLRRVQRNFVREGMVLGLLWFVICLVIDTPLMMFGGPMQMSPGEYMGDIGLTYLEIPVVTTGLAVARSWKAGP